MQQQANQDKCLVWYDGRNKAYSLKKLDKTEFQVPVRRQEYRGNEQFTVHLRLTKQLDPQSVQQYKEYLRCSSDYNGPRPSQEIVTALDCLIKHWPSIRTTRQGVNFYPVLGQGEHAENLGNGKCARSGFSLAFKASEKAHIQVKQKTGAFWKAQPLTDLLNETLFKSGGYGGGGGNRGGGRGGYQGNSRNNEPGQTVEDRHYINRQTRRDVIKHIKGLMVSYVQFVCLLIQLR